MVRPLRIEYPGAIYHVIARGNRRAAIFEDDEDRMRFLADLERIVKRYGWTVMAFCLMGNHYHLLVLVGDAGLARGMRDLNSAYCQAFNRRRGIVGHVLQGRYKSPLVERDGYLAWLVRYIVRNPVRARLCEHPGDWAWSSYRATVGQAPVPGFLATGPVLERFGETDAAARAAFAWFVESGGDDPDWDPLKGAAAFGSTEFVSRHAAPTGDVSRTEITSVQRLGARLALADAVAGASSDEALVEIHRELGYSMSAIARALGVHPATVSRRIRRAELGLR